MMNFIKGKGIEEFNDGIRHWKTFEIISRGWAKAIETNLNSSGMYNQFNPHNTWIIWK